MTFARSLALMIPILLLPWAPVPAEPERPVSISIALEFFGLDLEWNATDQTFCFNGTLALDDPVNREMDVSLFTAAPAGWSATCEPAVITFYHPGERAFTCLARYPAQTTNMAGNITVYGLAYWRGDALASNQSTPLAVRVTRLPVEKSTNLTNPHKIDFTTRLENVLPQLSALAVIVAAAVVGVAAWRWRRKRKRGQPLDGQRFDQRP